MVRGKTHAGIILARQQQHSIGQQLTGLLRFTAAYSAEDMSNQLVFLNSYLRN